MSESLGKATLQLEADGSGLSRDLADFEKKAGDAGDRASQGFGQKFSAGIQKATVPALAALGAIVVGAKKTTDAASDLNEAINVTGLVFGDLAGEIGRSAKGAADAVGMSERAYRQAAASVGGLLTNLQFTNRETADWSKTLITLGSDLGSAMNADPAQAVEAIGAAIRGETEPIRQFNVMLDDASVRAKAVAMGLADSTAEVDKNGKAQATLALIMEQTKVVHGDFARTAGDVANAERTQAGAAENLAASYGQALLPAREALNTAMGAAMGLLSEHKTATLVLIGVVAALAAGVLLTAAAIRVYTAAQVIARAAVVAWTVAQWLLNVALSANPIGLVVVAIGLLAAGIYIAYTRSETFRSGVDKLWGILRNTPLGMLIRSVDDVAGAFKTVVGWVTDLVNWIRKIPRTISIKVNVPGIGGGPNINEIIGRRAAGGPVSAGSPYVVGEKGPELFVPGRSGTIVPADAAGLVLGTLKTSSAPSFKDELDAWQGTSLLQSIAENTAQLVLLGRQSSTALGQETETAATLSLGEKILGEDFAGRDLSAAGLGVIWESLGPLTGLRLPPPEPRSLSPDGAVTVPIQVVVEGQVIEQVVRRVQFEKVRSGDVMPWSGSGFNSS